MCQRNIFRTTHGQPSPETFGQARGREELWSRSQRGGLCGLQDQGPVSSWFSFSHSTFTVMLAHSPLGLGPTKAQSCSYLEGATRPKFIPGDHRPEAGCAIHECGRDGGMGGPRFKSRLCPWPALCSSFSSAALIKSNRPTAPISHSSSKQQAHPPSLTGKPQSPLGPGGPISSRKGVGPTRWKNE